MKFILFVIVLVLGIACQFSNSQQVDDATLYEAFLDWKTSFNVFYTNDEMQQRFKAWKDNYLKVNELNNNNRQPDVIYTVVEEEPAALNSRNLLAVEPVIVETYPSNARFELNQFSDLTAEEFQTIYANADPTLEIPVAAASAALSTGAIVGIAVGGAVGIAAIGGATAYAIKKKKSSKQEEKSKSNEVPMKSQPSGINIFNPDTNPHHSITARAVYN